MLASVIKGAPRRGEAMRGVWASIQLKRSVLHEARASVAEATKARASSKQGEKVSAVQY